MDDLDVIKKKKLEQLKKQYMTGGKTMEKKWPDTPIHLLDADIDETMKKYPTIVIDCWAPWCGPCRTVAPIMDQLASDYAGRIKIAKLNTDDNPATASQYGIQSIPTLLFFKNGKQVNKLVGALPKAEIEKHLRSLV